MGKYKEETEYREIDSGLDVRENISDLIKKLIKIEEENENIHIIVRFTAYLKIYKEVPITKEERLDELKTKIDYYNKSIEDSKQIIINLKEEGDEIEELIKNTIYNN